MKNVSLKLDDSIYSETQRIISKLDIARNRYINEAIDFYNLLQKRRIIGKQLKKESRLVQEESMKVLNEFDPLDEKN